MDGERPERPQDPGLTDSLWSMTRDCWQQDPAQRPAITKVVGILREWLVYLLCTEPPSRLNFASRSYLQCAVDTNLFGLSPPRPVKATVQAKNIDSSEYTLSVVRRLRHEQSTYLTALQP
jgi:hypothetical protein